MGHDTETENPLKLVPANEYRRVRWKNGRGWTREAVQGALGTVSGGAEGWDWRLSIAEMDEDADFSKFPGIDRELMLLSGNGVRLVCNGVVNTLMPPHERLVFRGEDEVAGALVEGRVQVVNLMWRRDAVSLRSWFRPLVGPMLVFADPDETWLMHLVSGQARLDREPATSLLEAGDTVVLGGLGQRRRCMIEGAGSVLLAKVVPVAPVLAKTATDQ